MANRLINTSKERGIDEEKINSDTPEEAEEEPVGITDKTPPSVEEKTIETPQELLDTKKAINFEEMSEEEIQTKYLEILEKAEKKEKLSQIEIDFKEKVDAAIAKSEEKANIEYQKKLLEEKEIDLQKREDFLKEFIKTKTENPNSVIQSKDSDITLTGGSSIPKAIKFFLQMRKAKKKGGKVLVQVFRNKKVTISWTASDITYVEFHTTDENHNELIEVTRFNEFIYTYEGTPIPVLFAIQGVAEGYNFFESFRKDITSEMVSRLTTRAYHAGYTKGAELVNPNNNKNDILALLTNIMPIIMIIGFIVCGYLLWTQYDSMKAMYAMMQSMQATINTLSPTVVPMVVK